MSGKIAMSLRQHWSTLLIMALIAGAILVLRTPSDKISLADFERRLGAGKAVVVELYSNY